MTPREYGSTTERCTSVAKKSNASFDGSIPWCGVNWCRRVPGTGRRRVAAAGARSQASDFQTLASALCGADQTRELPPQPGLQHGHDLSRGRAFARHSKSLAGKQGRPLDVLLPS